ncbi:ATP-dependent DNA helicase [Trichonephila clavipes]|nr:ATP-dependent DNA helicase [Trichonephila clavipes]
MSRTLSFSEAEFTCSTASEDLFSPALRSIVRVHYFVRGGFVGYRSRASSKHLSSHLPVGSLDSSGSNRGCAGSEIARVGVESTKKPTPDVVVVSRRDVTMVIRNVLSLSPAIVRVTYFGAASDSENYYYSLLFQYVPYRDESELIVDFDTAREAFLAREYYFSATNARLEIFKEHDGQLEKYLTKFTLLKS